jgi:hypothetical protein
MQFVTNRGENMKLVCCSEKHEATIQLYIKSFEDGAIHLKARESDGTEWYLLDFRADGSVVCDCDIPERLGFRVDDLGRLVITG